MDYCCFWLLFGIWVAQTIYYNSLCLHMFAFMLLLVSVWFIYSIVVCTLSLLFVVIIFSFSQHPPVFLWVFWSWHTHTHTHTHLARGPSFTMHLFEIWSDIFACFVFVVFFSLFLRFFLLNICLCLCNFCSECLWSKIKRSVK